LKAQQFRGIRTLLVVCACLGVIPAWAQPAVAVRPDHGAEHAAFAAEMAERHGFEAQTIERTLRDTRFLPSVIRLMDAPPTALPWHEFRARHLTEARVRAGLQFWQAHRALLERAAARYRVPPELIVATIGIETHFGKLTGQVTVLDALATLAFGYPRRADFFRGELEHYLLLLREHPQLGPGLRGSFAGAIGIPQFMPGSYRRYAVDFDGDGVRDLRQVADAIGSVANYYREFGWREGEPVVIPADVGDSALDTLLGGGLQPHLAVGEYRRRGVEPLEPVADEVLASLFATRAEAGPRHWLGLHNFYVITRYNRSVNYAMVVHELAQHLRQGRPPR
jgi:membrane-bound lytic murein transglycosylase B